MWSRICACVRCEGEKSSFMQEEPTDHKETMFFSTDDFDSKSVYGTRPRIPSKVDLVHHPSEQWWSDARLDAAHVAEDMGPNPRILGRTLKVKVLERDQKSSDELQYFDSKQCLRNRRYLILQLLMGPKIIVSLAEVLDSEQFDSCFQDTCNKLKLIVNPTNVSIPWSITGPKNSASIGEFFGEENCSMKLKFSPEYICHAVVTIDVYSKFMIRSFLPKLAFQPGRICDFMLVDYEQRLIHTGFRLVSTETLLGLLRKIH